MRIRKIIRWTGLGLAAAVTALSAYLTHLHLSGNFHEVVAEELYRSAQVTAEDIFNYRSRYGIGSILNLRGASDDGWYVEETAAADRLGIVHADFAMSASRQLGEDEAAQLVALMRRLPKPLLVHCRHGSDRTGLAMALYLAAISGADEETAEGQLSLRFGHFAVPVLSDAWPMDESWERLESGLGFVES